MVAIIGSISSWKKEFKDSFKELVNSNTNVSPQILLSKLEERRFQLLELIEKNGTDEEYSELNIWSIGYIEDLANNKNGGIGNFFKKNWPYIAGATIVAGGIYFLSKE